ncbi:DUF4760 domain-containing protein [Paraburkholderia sp. J63]|uniref:DUF4760 domain-containing protein n=1 Tax=Paraburkholderia sp. J63 TaxID=2805434 RepID=UPI002ABD447D|nr:DUF4760 domain-containing protein [Paraburkholderia sp. J63]
MSPLVCWLLKNPTFPVVLASAIVALIGFYTTRHLTRSKHSIDFESSYHQSEKLSGAMKAMLLWMEQNPGWAATEALADTAEHEMVGHIREMLNTWERASIAVRRKVYDENLLYNAYGTSVIWMWKSMVPYMRKRQAKNPRLYMNFDWLAIRWMIRRNGDGDARNLRRLKIALRHLNKLH